MHEISLAFKSNSCREVRPRKTLAGRSLILLPYNTLENEHKQLAQGTPHSDRTVKLTKLSATLDR